MVRATSDQPDGCACTAAITLDEYLTLVGATGRIVRDGKRGAIPAALAPILDRLRLNGDGWLVLMRSGGQLGLGSFGALASCAGEALRQGARWIIDTTAGLYAHNHPAEPAAAPRSPSRPPAPARLPGRRATGPRIAPI